MKGQRFLVAMGMAVGTVSLVAMGRTVGTASLPATAGTVLQKVV